MLFWVLNFKTWFGGLPQSLYETGVDAVPWGEAGPAPWYPFVVQDLSGAAA